MAIKLLVPGLLATGAAGASSAGCYLQLSQVQSVSGLADSRGAEPDVTLQNPASEETERSEVSSDADSNDTALPESTGSEEQPEAPTSDGTSLESNLQTTPTVDAREETPVPVDGSTQELGSPSVDAEEHTENTVEDQSNDSAGDEESIEVPPVTATPSKEEKAEDDRRENSNNCSVWNPLSCLSRYTTFSR